MTATFLSALAAALTVDQVSKAAVARALADGETAGSWPVRLRHSSNPRIAFGLVSGRVSVLALWLATAAGTVALAGITDDRLAEAGLGAALGGVSGNAIDVLRRGRIVDFLDLRILPVFNLADVAILCGTAIAVWAIL